MTTEKLINNSLVQKKNGYQHISKLRENHKKITAGRDLHTTGYRMRRSQEHAEVQDVNKC